jgi:hypothetical protein
LNPYFLKGIKFNHLFLCAQYDTREEKNVGE